MVFESHEVIIGYDNSALQKQTLHHQKLNLSVSTVLILPRNLLIIDHSIGFNDLPHNYVSFCIVHSLLP